MYMPRSRRSQILYIRFHIFSSRNARVLHDPSMVWKNLPKENNRVEQHRGLFYQIISPLKNVKIPNLKKRKTFSRVKSFNHYRRRSHFWAFITKFSKIIFRRPSCRFWQICYFYGLNYYKEWDLNFKKWPIQLIVTCPSPTNNSCFYFSLYDFKIIKNKSIKTNKKFYILKIN